MERIFLGALLVAIVSGAAPSAAADDSSVRVSRRAEGLARRAAFHLDEARIERDVRRARCHDSVLSQTHAVLRMIRHRIDRLDGGADRHTGVLSVLDRRLDDLEAELRICNGEDRARAGRGTQVIVIVERWVPREDPTVLRDRRSWFDR